MSRVSPSAENCKYFTQDKVKPSENKDPFSEMCVTLDNGGTLCMMNFEEDEDAASVMSIVEKNTGGHFTTPIHFRRPVCLDDLSDEEVVDVTHLTRAGRHFKPSHLEDENPLEALRRKEKGKAMQLKKFKKKMMPSSV